MGQHSSVLQPLLLGILTAKCLPMKKLQVFLESGTYVKIEPQPLLLCSRMDCIMHPGIVSSWFTGGLSSSGRCMLQACWQGVFGCPNLPPQTCLAVPGCLRFAVLIVPEVLLILGAGLLLYLRILECKLCSLMSWFSLFNFVLFCFVLVGSACP